MITLKDIKREVLSWLEYADGAYEDKNGAKLFELDIDAQIEHVQALEGRQETILENYSIVDENEFAKKVKDLLIKYGGHDIDDMVFDILEVMEKMNEESRKTIS